MWSKERVVGSRWIASVTITWMRPRDTAGFQEYSCKYFSLNAGNLIRSRSPCLFGSVKSQISGIFLGEFMHRQLCRLTETLRDGKRRPSTLVEYVLAGSPLEAVSDTEIDCKVLTRRVLHRCKPEPQRPQGWRLDLGC